MFMKSSFGHIIFNIAPSSQSFYKELMEFLGWTVIYGDEHMIGFGNAQNGSLWFMSVSDKKPVNYDDLGENHIGINVETQKDVDEAVDFLKRHNVAPLFDTPRHRKEFATSDTNTYYQVMFETPDKILFEVLYSGPKE